MDVQYLCDRRKCENCSPECKHTTDISHAKNFKNEGDAVWEKEPAPVVIFKTKGLFKQDLLNTIRKSLKTQLAEGFIVLSPFIDVQLIDPDTAIVYDVVITERKDETKCMN